MGLRRYTPTLDKALRVLVLNGDYSAHALHNWQDALSLTIQEIAINVDYYDYYIRDSVGNEHVIPSVIALKQYVKKKAPPFSRKNIFIRDELKCQYCGARGYPWEMTYDHVVPRCRWDQSKNGTPTHWSNIVTCCPRCNKYKAGRTPKEARMRLVRKPFVPSGAGYIHGLAPWNNVYVDWKAYLPKMYANWEKYINGVL